MKRRFASQALLLGAGLAGALAGGYWLGRSNAPQSLPAVAPAPALAPADPARPVIYYKDPSGKAEFSPVPKKDAAGRDFLPVHADEEASASVPAPTAPKPAAAPGTHGKILFYRNPMGLPDTSPVPKRDPMGMDYVPVYEGEDGGGDDGATVTISPAKIQKLGVRTEAAALRQMTRTIRAVGTVELDERRVSVVAPKFEGYIETLRVDTTGQSVKRGQPLLETYSPDLVLAQQEYLAAWQSYKGLSNDADAEAREAAKGLVDGALQRLRNWDIDDGQLRRLQQQGKPSRTMTITAPSNGIVLEKTALAGMRFMPGEALFKIADLSTVWVIAQVYEQELSSLREGQKASLTFAALPGVTLEGKVSFIYPTLSAESRTVGVRIELPNPDRLLKPAFYGNVLIATKAGGMDTLAVPDSALIDSGTRKVVLLARGEGKFEPREVTTGVHADGYVQIIDGVTAGDQVVVSANFLIDAESNLRAALQSFHDK